MAKVALRTSVIWNDEVMGDVMSERPRSITIGPADGSTFITPPLGLPPRFAIVRPGRRGFVMTLGEHMRGTVCLGGVEHDVATLVRATETPGFFATAIADGDWGLVELEPSGHHKLFFQFVPVDDSDRARRRWRLLPDFESRASLTWSVMLHAVLLLTTYRLYVHDDPFVWPGPRELTANYLAARIHAQDPTPATRPSTQPAPGIAASIQQTVHREPPQLPPPPWHEPIVRQKPKAPGPPGISAEALRVIAGVTGTETGDPRRVNDGAKRTRTQIKTETTRGEGHGSGSGSGEGPTGEFTPFAGGGGGSGSGSDSGEPITLRKATFCGGSHCGGGDGFQLKPPEGHTESIEMTEEDINRVVQAHAKQVAACYQAQLSRNPSLSGGVRMQFHIAADGHVTEATVVASSIASDEVGTCIQHKVMLWHFPAKGGALVRYPFVFSSTD
jgi:hypothetical protein